ncbi:MAG: domain S-box protein [Marmoricola sp.]|nr:domain S-box protein [Marmoricola sp.]
MTDSRRTGLQARAVLGTLATRVLPVVAVPVLTAASLTYTTDPGVVTRWWAATAVATAVVLLAPRRHTRSLLGLLALLFLGAGLAAGRGWVFSAGFALANVAECGVLVWWLTGMEIERAGLRTWRELRRCLTGVALACTAAGFLTALTLGVGGAQGIGDLWRPMLWVALTHAESQAVLLPLVLARSAHRVRVARVEVAGHLVLLGVGALAVVTASPREPVAFLLLPLLVWSSARFTQTWAGVELLGVAAGLAALTASGRGPFARDAGVHSLLEIASSAQAFIAVGALTSVSFSVAMSHLRDSLRTIRENEAQLGQLLDSANGTAFVATDPRGVITWFSPGAELMLGYAAEDVVGRTTPMAFHESREVLARARELGCTPDFGVVTTPVDAGACQDTRDWTYVRKDGSRLSVSLSVTVSRDAGGSPTGHLSVLRDVTDRRAAEQALVFALDRERETNQRMLELDRAKTEFVSSVSHELRTPLTSIVGYTELLGDPDVVENLTEVQRQLVQRIERNGERLLALVEDLLTLARVEDGSFELDRTRVDLRDAVVHATDELAHAAHQHRVHLTTTVPDEPVCVDGDPTHLERLVLNLASNAVKFTPPGGSVDVDLTTDGVEATLVVRDTGMGIPVAEQGRLFQRFFRSSLASEHAIQGTGLGLSIVKAIAAAHGGEVGFTSVPGEGTSFTFVLPRSAPATVARPALEVLPEGQLEVPSVPVRR